MSLISGIQELNLVICKFYTILLLFM